MPFTLAHPIAALPIWRVAHKRLNLAGLMVGAIVPDISYFLYLRPVSSFRHTVPGAMSYDIVEGLLLLCLLRYVWLRPLLAILPRWIARRCALDWQWRWPGGVQVGILAVSIALGALSHLFWDSFSHETGWFVQQISLLRSILGPLPIYKWVQYLSGILGLIALIVWGGGRLRQTEPKLRVPALSMKWQAIVWFGVMFSACLFSWLAIILYASAADPFSVFVVQAVIGTVSGSFLGLSVYATGYWLIKFR